MTPGAQKGAGLFLGLWLTSCGAAGPVLDDRPASETLVETVGDLRLITVERPTDGRLWLSLYVDAGSRDGPRPSVAAFAALAASHTHDSIRARTIPDGTELTMTCRAPMLARCLSELAAVLATREIDEARFERVRRDWRRRRALALSDGGRRAPSLAVSALLGRDLDPYEGEEPTREEVESFLSDHFGSERALLIAIGDAGGETLEQYAERAFADSPRARTTRARREPEVRRDVRIELTDRGAGEVAVATLEPSIEVAHALAERWVARSAAFGVEHAQAEVFPIRGGAIALVTGIGDQNAAALMVSRLRELEPENLEHRSVRRGDDPSALARWLGARWCAEGGAATEGGVGVGVIAVAGRGDDLESADPDRVLREDLEARVRDVLRGAPTLSLEGSIGPDRADVTSPRGASLRGVRIPGAAEIAITITFDGGASEEDPSLHGVTAMLASVLADACDEIAREELGGGLGSLGFEVRPTVTTSRWGLSITGPRERWAELTYLAPRCVSTLRPTATRLANARIDLEGPFALRGELARSLEPTRPGGLAPEGRADSRAGVEAAELRRWFRSRAVTQRVRVGLAGDLRIDLALTRVAEGVARLPEGSAFEDSPAEGVPLPLRGVHQAEGLGVGLGWSAAGDDASVARGFAEAAAAALERTDGLRALFADGTAFGGRAYAWIGLTATPDALDALVPLVERALATLSLDALSRRLRADREEALAWTGGTPRSLAAALIEDPSPPDESAIRAQLEGLRRATPTVVVARPQPGHR